MPIPTRTASAANLSRWPSSRAASPVIHLDAPSAAAILPSSVMAALSVTWGRPSVTAQRNARFSARASVSRTPTVDGHAGRLKSRQTAAVDGRMRIAHGRHHPRDARSHERVRARRRAPEVGARLERHVASPAARSRAGRIQRRDLGMGPAGSEVRALADDPLDP